MRTIHKYKLEVREEPQIIEAQLAQGGILHAGLAPAGVLCVWLEIRDDVASVPISFRVVGTGWQMVEMDGFRHVGSVTQGAFVWHVYESH